MAANSIFAINDQPDGDQPFIERIGESSNTLCVLTLNCLWHSFAMHFQMRREDK